MLLRVVRFGVAALALFGALAIALLALGLVGVHGVTSHFRSTRFFRAPRAPFAYACRLGAWSVSLSVPD